MGKMQISRVLICSCVAISISLAQQISNGSSTRSHGLVNQRPLPPQLRSGLLRHNAAINSVVRTPSTDNQSATAELSEQKQTQGTGSRGETPQLQTVAGFGPQQQFPSYARPGPPYLGFNFGTPSAYPQQPESAGQPGSPQIAQQIQPRATPFYPSGFGGFNYQTTADFFNRFNPSPQGGKAGASSASSSSTKSETGSSSGNATPAAQVQNFGTNFGGSFPFSAGFGQNFPQSPFPSPGFGTTGQGSPVGSTPDDGTQRSVVGFYGNGAPNIGSYSFSGGSQQEQQFQPPFQNSFQPPGFGQGAGFGQLPSGAGFDSFGQFGFGPSGGLAGSEISSGDIQNTQPTQPILSLG